jgi:hypothetical protein
MYAGLEIRHSIQGIYMYAALEIHHSIQGICRGARSLSSQLPWCPACFLVFKGKFPPSVRSIEKVPFFQQKMLCPFDTEILALHETDPGACIYFPT